MARSSHPLTKAYTALKGLQTGNEANLHDVFRDTHLRRGDRPNFEPYHEIHFQLRRGVQEHEIEAEFERAGFTEKDGESHPALQQDKLWINQDGVVARTGLGEGPRSTGAKYVKLQLKVDQALDARDAALKVLLKAVAEKHDVSVASQSAGYNVWNFSPKK